mmetsp:Transcript_50647/g.99184  ORF Transcript_50647/g.99184 Transcript_50647/m.99184 type:complete len:283 (-) Transcript_50647:254-1102(-)
MKSYSWWHSTHPLDPSVCKPVKVSIPTVTSRIQIENNIPTSSLAELDLKLERFDYSNDSNEAPAFYQPQLDAARIQEETKARRAAAQRRTTQFHKKVVQRVGEKQREKKAVEQRRKQAVADKMVELFGNLPATGTSSYTNIEETEETEEYILTPLENETQMILNQNASARAHLLAFSHCSEFEPSSESEFSEAESAKGRSSEAFWKRGIEEYSLSSEEQRDITANLRKSALWAERLKANALSERMRVRGVAKGCGSKSCLCILAGKSAVSRESYSHSCVNAI